MNETKAVICILAAVFILMACLMLTASFISKRISDGWLMGGSTVFALMAITCFAAARMRGDADHKAVMDAIEAEHQAKMAKIRNGILE